MIIAQLWAEDDFDVWRDQAKTLLAMSARPSDIVWQVGSQPSDLFGEKPMDVPAMQTSPLSVPRSFVQLARTVICHSNPQRFALLYQLLSDLLAGTRRMDDAADPLLGKLNLMAKAVRRDIHKMRAFLRFREITDEGGAHFIAWFEPEHYILRRNAAFFTTRFANMRWTILTPRGSLHWDGDTLSEGPPARREDAPSEDAVEEQWHSYYRSIFNPARLKVGAMLKEMPRKYWRNMPETAFVPEMIAGAQARMTAMIKKEVEQSSAQTLADLRQEADRCRRCPLYGPATQLIFGEGQKNARLMFVGEQPGYEEDLAGRSFVGPAGRLLDAALGEAGIDRSKAYITNAVKHFKYEQRGKPRIHQRPNVGEINHCRWWLTREIAIVRPQLIVALGATAIRSLTGKTWSIKDARSASLHSIEDVPIAATIHPSYLLRLPNRELAAREHRLFVDDLRRAHDQLEVAA